MNKYRYILFQRYIKFDMFSQKHILKLQYIRPAFVAKTLTKCKSALKIEIFIITSDILEQAINLTFTFIHLLTDSSIDPVIKERTTLVCPNFSPTLFNTLQDLPLGSRPNQCIPQKYLTLFEFYTIICSQSYVSVVWGISEAFGGIQ